MYYIHACMRLWSTDAVLLGVCVSQLLTPLALPGHRSPPRKAAFGWGDLNRLREYRRQMVLMTRVILAGEVVRGLIGNAWDMLSKLRFVNRIRNVES